jgi:TRAP-type transport system periplasmic protein
LWPPVNIFGTGKPIRSAAEFSGRKLRTLSPQEAEMLRRLGASSVSLTTSDVPVALERGTVEGVFTTGFNMVGSKWGDFCKWAYIADVHGADDYIIVNAAAYDKLSPRVRQVLDEVAKEWAPKMTQANLAAEAGSIETLRTKGGMEIFRASKQDADRITDKMKDYWPAWAKQTGPDAVAMLEEIRAAIGK